LLPSDKTIGACLLQLSNAAVTIKYITTPGHTGGCCSLIIEGALRFESKNYEKVAFVGDLWDEEDDESFYKSLSESQKHSVLARKYILNTVKPDLIFPGHGPPFAPQKHT
jgi:glyoxylase-like metal-dependent hydrolase (beta-lactamase superfamily II)